MITDVNDITSFKWATVKGVNPISIQLDGDTAPLPLIPDTLVDPLTLFVGARVRTELSLRKVVIHGVNDGGNTFITGELRVITANSVPNGWLLANGQSLLRSDYPGLFAAIGTTFGAVDSTHFTLPDLRGKVVAGLDTTQTEFNARGKTGGEKAHMLTIAEMPSHNHDLIINRGTNPVVSGAGTQGYLWGETAGSKFSGSTGGGGSHNNLQPYIALNYIIKL